MNTWEDMLDQLEAEKKERMRPFSKLSNRKKIRRIVHSIGNFFVYRVWGKYKGGGLVGAYHWIRCHTWNRYHVIDISDQGEYDWGWVDRDHAMWLVCFKLLVDFVEFEDPDIGKRKLEDYKPSWYTMEEWHENEKDFVRRQISDDEEIRLIYDWWKTGRKSEQDILRAIDVGNYRGPNWEAYKKMSEELEKKDDEMFDRLMKIRKRLWT